MSYFTIKKLQKKHISRYNVKEFILKMIQSEYGYGFIPEYHQDIKNMETYYLDHERNNFFVAIHHETEKVIGTIGIRAYDKDFPIFKDIYNPQTTASIWRVFVDKKWRRNGVASNLVRSVEEFCRDMDYHKVYLHTHKTVQGSLDFWISNGYKIMEDTENHLKTVHMEKKLYPLTNSSSVFLMEHSASEDNMIP